MKELKKYLWKLRILYIHTPSYSNPDYLEAKKAYSDNLYKFHRRYVKMITKISNHFMVQLIGLDGEVKHEYDRVDPKKIFSDIDKMPMGNLRKEINLSLYSDYHESASKKGFGFKDKDAALKTLKLLKGEPLAYKKQVVITMYNRAKYHPNRTDKMKDAMKVYKKWMKKHNIKT